MNWQHAEPAPAILVLPPAAASLDEAHAAIELWEHYSRKRLDLTQRLVVEVTMAQASDGQWAAATTGREMPRQNGKGDEIEVVELWGLVQRAEAIMHTVHDAVLLASQTQQRMLGVLEGHPDLRRKVKRKWLGTGQQMIEMRNGGIIWYRTRTGGGGRGVDDIDRLVVDEAQHAQEEHLAAVSPTLFANPNPQMNAMGTAGLEGKSAWWWTMRKRALGPDPGAFGYVGHTAENVRVDESGRVVQEPVDAEDRSLWLRSNPALHAGRGGGMAFFEEQLRRLGPQSFAQEHMCVWDPPPADEGGWETINEGGWKLCQLVGHTPAGDLRYSLEVDTNARGETWASIGASDGTHLEVVTPAPGEEFAGAGVQYGPGTGWVVPVCARRKDEIGELLIVKGSAASALVPDLEAAGVKVRLVTMDEFADASMQLDRAVLDATVRHIGQRQLNAAAASVKPKAVGDGKWRFSRTASTGDVGPVCAVAVARWGALHGASTEAQFFGAWA